MNRNRGSGHLEPVFACVLAVGLGSGGAFAQPGAVHIPAQSLSQSLNDVARQTGANILFAPESVSGLKASAVDGQMSAEQAVERLLAGSKLEVVADPNGGLIVRPKPAPAQASGEVEAAAPTPAAVREYVIVTGFRGSLQRNLDIKRTHISLLDAITFEDIGKFPDSNLAAAMMRLPGVTVNRGVIGTSGIDTTTGDPTEITVRGFGPTFNQILFDGRKVPSGVGDRSFDFSAVNADLVQEIDVLKSSDASLPTGAIGATIDVKYPKPFDSPGLRFAASTSTTYSPEEGKMTPNGMFLFSDTFAGDRFGVLFAAAYAETKNRSNEATVWGWEGTYLDPCQFAGGPVCGAKLTPDTTRPVWFIQDYGVYQIHNWILRESGRAAFQWHPSDAVILTLNGDFSRNELKERQSNVAIWNNANEMRGVTTSANGTITDFTRYNSPTDFDAGIVDKVLQDYDLGINLQWQVDNSLSVTADADIAVSSLNPGDSHRYINADVGYGPSCVSGCTPAPTNGNNVGMAVSGSDGHTLPYFTSYGPGGDESRFLDSEIMGSHVMVMSSPRNRNLVNQVKLEVAWSNGSVELTAGFQYLADHIRRSNYDDFVNNQWQAFAGYGPDSNNYYPTGPGTPYPAGSAAPAGVHLPAELFTKSFGTRNFIPGWRDVDKLPPHILVFDPVAVYDYLQSLGDPTGPTAIPGFNWGCCTPDYHGKFEITLDPDGYLQVFENNAAGYFSLKGSSGLFGMPLHYRAGVRIEHTQLTSTGLARTPTGLTVMPSDHTALLVSYGAMDQVTAHNSYQYFLPNLDVELEVSDDIVVRANASRTLSRPRLTNISPVTTLATSERVGSLVATGQNPDLMPYLSDNFDLTGEWYYAPNCYASVDAYLKHVSNFIVASTVTEAIDNLIDPTTGTLAQFRVSTYVNGPSALVYGLEFAWQHMFGESGFGVQANATVVRTDAPYNPHDISTSNFAVTGLADSANLVALYDKSDFQIRLTANWRDSYLDHFGQSQPDSAFGSEPVFVNPSWDFGASASYDITRQLTLYAEALNLLDSTYSTRGRFSEQVLDVVAYGRRFTLGLHYRL